MICPLNDLSMICDLSKMICRLKFENFIKILSHSCRDPQFLDALFGRVTAYFARRTLQKLAS